MGLYLEEFTPAELRNFVKDAYADNFDTAAIAPTAFTDDGTGLLELWHGPTCAFKDMQKRGGKIGVCCRELGYEIIGVNTPEQLAQVESLLKK